MLNITDTDYKIILFTLLEKLDKVVDKDINDIVRKSFAENGIIMPEILRDKFGRNK